MLSDIFRCPNREKGIMLLCAFNHWQRTGCPRTLGKSLAKILNRDSHQMVRAARAWARAIRHATFDTIDNTCLESVHFADIICGSVKENR